MAAKPKSKPKEIPPREIPTTNEINAFMHCKRCLDELPLGYSPRDYASLECGWTKLGFQVWCKRHEANIIHVDFQGVQHPANQSRSDEQPHH